MSELKQKRTVYVEPCYRVVERGALRGVAKTKDEAIAIANKFIESRKRIDSAFNPVEVSDG